MFFALKIQLDQVVVMHEGQIVQTGTPVELFEKPKHTFVGHFIGSPGMNILPCEIKNGQINFEGKILPTEYILLYFLSFTSFGSTCSLTFSKEM